MAQESWKCDQDETGCQPPDGPILCVNNCGFFGSKATMNLCSKCYRDVVLSQAAKPKTKESPLTIGEPVTTEVLDVPAETPSAQEGNPTESSPGSSSRPPNRCFACNKRVGLTGFNCRCGNVFCSLHRYSDKHNCTYDYKTVGRDAIAKANPVVKADKLDKI